MQIGVPGGRGVASEGMEEVNWEYQRVKWEYQGVRWEYEKVKWKHQEVKLKQYQGVKLKECQEVPGG